MTHALYDVYVVNDHGVHDFLYAVDNAYAKSIAKDLDGAVVVPSGERPAKKKPASSDD